VVWNRYSSSSRASQSPVSIPTWPHVGSSAGIFKDKIWDSILEVIILACLIQECTVGDEAYFLTYPSLKDSKLGLC
jgi:hypothetical protein